MTYLKTGAAIALAICTASCASSGPVGYGRSDDLVTVDQYYATHQVNLVTVDDYYAEFRALPPDPNRKISEQDCTTPFTFDGSNLRCR